MAQIAPSVIVRRDALLCICGAAIPLLVNSVELRHAASSATAAKHHPASAPNTQSPHSGRRCSRRSASCAAAVHGLVKVTISRAGALSDPLHHRCVPPEVAGHFIHGDPIVSTGVHPGLSAFVTTGMAAAMP